MYLSVVRKHNNPCYLCTHVHWLSVHNVHCHWQHFLCTHWYKGPHINYRNKRLSPEYNKSAGPVSSINLSVPSFPPPTLTLLPGLVRSRQPGAVTGKFNHLTHAATASTSLHHCISHWYHHIITQYHRGITSPAHGRHLLHSDRRQLSPAVTFVFWHSHYQLISSKLVHNTPLPTTHLLRFLATPTTWHSPQICCGCDQKKVKTLRGRVDSVAIVAIAPVIRMMHLTCASHAPMLP